MHPGTFCTVLYSFFVFRGLHFFYSFFCSFFFQFFAFFYKAVEMAGDFGAGDSGGLKQPGAAVHRPWAAIGDLAPPGPVLHVPH